MAKVSAKGAVITIDGTDISADVSTYSIEYSAPPQDVTGFTEGSMNYVPGQFVIGVTLDCFWNSANDRAFAVLQPLIGSTTASEVAITPEVGGLTLTGDYMVDGITPAGTSAGSPISLGSVHFSVMGAVAPAWA